MPSFSGFNRFKRVISKDSQAKCFVTAPQALHIWKAPINRRLHLIQFLGPIVESLTGHGLIHLSDQLAHRNSRIGHAVREAPLIVIPGEDRHEIAIHYLSLVHVEDRGMRVMVEVDRYIGRIGVA